MDVQQELTRESCCSYSIEITIPDTLDYSSHGQSINDVSRPAHVENDTRSNLNVSRKSDEVGKEAFSRWDDCLNHKLQTELLTNQSNEKEIIQPLLHSVVVREFLPRTARDSILSILRELFVRSFDQFYKEIEAQLKLKTNKTLMEWLEETFDEMQDDILDRKQRCFMICSTDEVAKNGTTQGIIGFLTLTEEEKGSVYIAQCAIEPENKRRGYGARLLQHLRTTYPQGTLYWGLCRRANRPAVNFYLKHGAKFMDDEEVAKKYGYDPALYTGFQFTDGLGSHTQSNASDTSFLLSKSSTIISLFDSVLTRRSGVTFQDKSTMTDPLPEIDKRLLHKRNSCCVIL